MTPVLRKHRLLRSLQTPSLVVGIRQLVLVWYWLKACRAGSPIHAAWRAGALVERSVQKTVLPAGWAGHFSSGIPAQPTGVSLQSPWPQIIRHAFRMEHSHD
jgi:hypothetical protein